MPVASAAASGRRRRRNGVGPAEHRRHLSPVAATVAAVATPALAGASAACQPKTDMHGVWVGSLSVGGNYTLHCERGYAVGVGEKSGNNPVRDWTISCPESGRWDEDPECVNVDNCQDLRHGCGAKGICIDEVDGYTCSCEEGSPLLVADDGSGELLCGGYPDASTCNGSSCGAHGVCIDLSSATGGYQTGNRSFRCSCAVGYKVENSTCVPVDCGARSEPFGAWTGQTTFGGEYTVHCHQGSFVLHGFLRSTTISCPAVGEWPTDSPVCFNAWMETVDAGFASFRFWFAALCAAVCIVFAALAAGLTMGLVSIENFDLRLLLMTRAEDCESREHSCQLELEQHAAASVAPLLKDHHRLLVTLLLLNSLANEALPIFLDQILPAWLAVLVSVTCVLFFGEILPSALFTGPQKLPLAAALAPVVRCFMCAFAPAALPIKRLLDRVVGHDEAGPKYSRAELKALLELHRHGVAEDCDTLCDVSGTTESGDEEDAVSSSGLCSSRLKGAADEAPENSQALVPLECRLAQRSLNLSRLRLSALTLPTAPGAGGDNGVHTRGPPVRLDGAMSVSEALRILSGGPPGQRCTIVGMVAGTPDRTLTREELLWAVLCPHDLDVEA